MPCVPYIRRESNTRLRLDSIFSIPALVKSASGVHDFNLAFVLLTFCFCLCRILTFGFLFLAGSGHIDGAGSTVFVGFMGEYLDRPACSIGEHSGSQSSCPGARRIRAVTNTRQGLIGYGAPVMPRVLHGHSGYGAFKGHGKEDVTSKVSDPSPILPKEVTTTKTHARWMTFW